MGEHRPYKARVTGSSPVAGTTFLGYSMKLIVAGSRQFKNELEAYKSLVDYLDTLDITEVVSGCAKGADSMGEYYASINDIPIRKFPANWKKYGKAAGFIQNEEMAKYAAVVLWNGTSKGSKHMIDTAKKQGLELKVIHV